MPLTKSETSAITQQIANFAPKRILEVELGQPLPAISAFDNKTGRCYQRVLCLVRLHTQPLGIVELRIEENEMSAHKLAEHLWQALQKPINQHLDQDGLPGVAGLDVAGLSCSGLPQCLEERHNFLAHAPFVSIVVSTRDRPESMQSCLRSLLALQYPAYEIIVVDNAPTTNATADLIQQTYGNVSRVRYLREDRPGLSRGRNCGLMAARGEIVAFTDDDVAVDPHWLTELVRGFSTDTGVVCVTGLILPLELETPAQLWLEEFGGFNKGLTRRTFDLETNRSEKPLHPYTTGQFGTAANMAFTTAFLRSVGGFDPGLGAGSPARGGEELAAFFQVITQGHKLVYEPASLLYHRHHRDYASFRKQIYSYGVGLSAYLTKSLLDHPRFLLNFLSKVPYGLFFTLSDRSPKNHRKSTHYPKELSRLELKGMAYGSLAYLRNRQALRNERKAPGTSKGSLAS